ncbi:HAD family hydrolase [Allonocardiopsis opalescens]|uniref:HAD superfamily hydrolase (TIGR01490 family) n=1 Tax=Allonocardiopsis opalescens TaxID=1144618 RepID=A0A2T0QAX0_9ACTN|nr:HAD-IB family hydrolase [Allonocardiopsis opalescens]PRY01019.1 HAD superfamily hydrolase (TIGR01490 family) [Allonocardiopsis opalescens]
MDTTKRAAFFDVDETVISAKSMFDFLRFWLARNGDQGDEYNATAGRLRDLAHNGGMPRSEVNRSYYRLFAGVPMAELAEAGREWYDQYRTGPAAFVESSLAAIRTHREEGDTIVLVSGSFRGCLEPIARDVSADIILCTEPIVGADGLLTGEVHRPMIGPAKADAVQETIERLDLDPAVCFAYGDHSTDLEMLSRVGNPAVVGEDPVLLDHAARNGWPVLPAVYAGSAA